MALYQVKKNKRWILKALDRESRRTIAWVIGDRSAQTVQRLYKKLEHCKRAIFYTDDWDAFTKVLPQDRHIIGKAHTVSIERDNSNTRHYLARMTRRTKVITRSEEMIDLSLRLWLSLSDIRTFRQYQLTFLSIFR